MKRPFQNIDNAISKTFLTKDLVHEIMINLDVNEVNKLCNVNTDILSYCTDELWQFKYKEENLQLSFIDEPDVNKDIYILAYNVFNEGKLFLDEILPEEYIELYIYLPIITENTWIIEHFLPVQDIYTGILKIIISYVPYIGYVYKKQLLYKKDNIYNISQEYIITKRDIIELLGYIMYSGYTEIGDNHFQNDSDQHDNDVLQNLLKLY